MKRLAAILDIPMNTEINIMNAHGEVHTGSPFVLTEAGFRNNKGNVVTCIPHYLLRGEFTIPGQVTISEELYYDMVEKCKSYERLAKIFREENEDDE